MEVAVSNTLILNVMKCWLKPVIIVAAMLHMPSSTVEASPRKETRPQATQERFAIETKKGLRFEGVLYKHLLLDDSHIIRFSRRDGLKVFDVSGRLIPDPISSQEFVDAAEKLVVQIQRSGGNVDEIQVDLNLVAETWSDIRKAVRRAVLIGSGPLQAKDRSASRAMRDSIRASKQVALICSMIKRRGMECDQRNDFVEEIAFQEKYASVKRDVIAKADDVGLSEQLRFSISFVRIARDKVDQ
jgi:hypothetical protein